MQRPAMSFIRRTEANRGARVTCTPRVPGRWLGCLGVPAPWIPPEGSQRVALWKKASANRHLAILIDNVASPRELHSLIPGPGPTVVATTSQAFPAQVEGLTGLIEVG